MHKFIGIFLAFLLGVGSLGQAAEDSKKPNFKVVMHLDSDHPDLFNKTISHMQNILRDSRLAGDVEVILVANSEGIRLLMETYGDYEPRLRALHQAGVSFRICQNSMNKFQYERDRFYDFVSVVETAMGELIMLQSLGYAYIHPTAPWN